MNHWVIAPVLLPWSIAILLLLAGRASLGWRRGASVAAVAAQIGLALALALEVSDGDILVYALGHWPAPFGIVLVADRLAAWMLVVTAFLALFALLYAIRGDDAAGAHFHSLFQLQLFGLNGAFLTGDLFNLFVFFEVLLIASYGLLLHGGGRRRTRAGLQFVAVNVIGSTLFLFAVGTLYGVLGTLNMADLALEVAATPPADALLVRAAGLLLFGVFALKAALLPFLLVAAGRLRSNQRAGRRAVRHHDQGRRLQHFKGLSAAFRRGRGAGRRSDRTVVATLGPGDFRGRDAGRAGQHPAPPTDRLSDGGVGRLAAARVRS